MRLESLPPGVTLRLHRLPKVGEGLASPLFSASSHWLHPLFELEDFLNAHRGPEGLYVFGSGEAVGAEGLFLRDHVIGTAAALLILRLGLREVETDLLSRRALELLMAGDVAVEAVRSVEKIGCLTEDLLKDETDPEAAYRLIAERRTRALERLKPA